MKLNVFTKKLLRKIRGGRVTLRPESVSRGRVLLSYKTEPFVEYEAKEQFHTNIWECREIARIFLKLGYMVDVIDWFNRSWKPKKKYRYCVDLGLNLERMEPLLGSGCPKIFHATTSHWLFNNNAEQQRLLELQKRRGVLLRSRRSLAPNSAIEHADFCTLLGNEVTESTYAFAKKKICRIPISTTHTYSFPENRDFEKAKKSFVWLGGVGMVHKGLDLALEAFARLPEYRLFVCGDVAAEKDFEDAYRKELYDTENIKTLGKVDVGSNLFKSLVSTSATLVHPSCSEGQSGSVIVSMHAGLIPVVSRNSGVTVGDFGILIEKETVEGMAQAIQRIATMPSRELEERARKAWQYAREHHTRERFSEEFTKFVTMLETGN